MGYSQVPAAATNGVQLRYTLTSSGTLTIPGASTANPITATVVCIGGGAGGSPNFGASYIGNNLNGNTTTYGNVCGGGFGGNAGNASVGQVLIAGPVTYIIGAGGTGATASNSNNNQLVYGNSGGNSVFANLIGIGGQGIGSPSTAYFSPANMGTFLSASSINFNTTVPTTGSLYGKGFNADGTYGGNYSFDSNGYYKGISSRQSTGSHAGGSTGMGCNSTSTGGPTTVGTAGEAGGTGGGGTAGLAQIVGPSTITGGASSSTGAYTIANGTNVYVGGGGGGGGSGRTDGGTAQLGGAGGAASQYGGTGGTGGSGASVSGSGTASGSNGGNATGYGAGGGGGGGGAAGPNAATANNTNGGVVTGNGGNGSQGVILIFY